MLCLPVDAITLTRDPCKKSHSVYKCEAKMWIDLLKLLAIRGEDETGGWENCSLLLRCCFRFCRKRQMMERLNGTEKKPVPRFFLYFLPLNDKVYQIFLTSVLTSRTDLKSLDMEASLDCGKQMTQQS